MNQKRTFIGGTDKSLLTSLFESFLWEDMSNDISCEMDEIRVTVARIFKDGNAYIDSGFYTKADLLELVDEEFYNTTGYTKEQYENQSTENIFSDLVSYYDISNMGLFGSCYITINDWYEFNKESLDFNLSDIMEYVNTVNE
jgi:hypothetical protein